MLPVKTCAILTTDGANQHHGIIVRQGPEASSNLRNELHWSAGSAPKPVQRCFRGPTILVGGSKMANLTRHVLDTPKI